MLRVLFLILEKILSVSLDFLIYTLISNSQFVLSLTICQFNLSHEQDMSV